MNDLKLSSQKDIKDLEKHTYFLNMNDLKILSKRGDLTSFEKKQILFTYDYYNSLYDKGAEKIDDLKQQKLALDLNKSITSILEYLVDLIAINNIDVKKGE